MSLQRHPLRNLETFQGVQPFTLRLPSEMGAQAQLSLGLQTEVRYNDNVNNAPRALAVGDTIIEWTPVIRMR